MAMSTLMIEARHGITDEIREVARAEGIDADIIRRRVAAGRIVIPHNSIHNPRLVGIGEELRVKINANIGTSPDHIDINEELEKVKIADKYGADTIMDLSIGGNLDEIRRKILAEAKMPVGTVPVYQAGIDSARKGTAIVDMSEDYLFKVIEKHARDGVDFMTVHCGVTYDTVKRMKKHPRTLGVVSRGGAFLIAWMLHNDAENPLYKNFDYLLEIAREYDFTLSLGDGLRPGAIADATDYAQLSELFRISELVRRAREAGVQAMVEGPGHVPLHMIETNVRLEKSVCDGAPFYVLGPVVTDIGAGYDHITAAIGGALAAYYGADFLCYVTPAEHLALPTVEDVKIGVIAAKIAAHSADVARGKGVDIELEMARARRDLDWKKMFSLLIDEEKARMYRAKRAPTWEDTCSMCGEHCAIKIVKRYLYGEGD